MARLRPLRFLAPVLAAGVLAAAANATAGELSMRDDAHVFSSSDRDALNGVLARAPFDARLVTTSAYADQPGFSRYVGSLVAEPNMMVVGIDPEHHHVQVHFGTGSHIPRAAWPDIEHAGNDAFKRGAWEEGAADIFRAGQRAVVTGSQGQAPAQEGTSLVGSIVKVVIVGGILLLIGGIIVAAMVFGRRRGPDYGGGYGGGGYGGGAYPGGGPYYGQGGQPGGMGALGGGVIGAGVGGVVGYELGRAEAESEERRRREHGGYDGGGGGGYDGRLEQRQLRCRWRRLELGRYGRRR